MSRNAIEKGYEGLRYFDCLQPPWEKDEHYQHHIIINKNFKSMLIRIVLGYDDHLHGAAFTFGNQRASEKSILFQ